MSALLMTGFPGFLGSALLPKLLARREGYEAICLVQPQHLATAEKRVAAIAASHPHTEGRISLITGDLPMSERYGIWPPSTTSPFPKLLPGA